MVSWVVLLIQSDQSKLSTLEMLHVDKTSDVQLKIKKKKKTKPTTKTKQQPNVMNTVVFFMAVTAALCNLVGPIELGFSNMIWQIQYNVI